MVFGLILLAQTPTQTRWVAKTGFFAQPRFWPAVGLMALVGLGGLHLVKLPWRRFTGADWVEVRKWAAALEYAIWFMAYVLVVPVIGYLPASIVFAATLSWRLGYRTTRMIAVSILFAIATVIVFKSFLSVKIPGGMIYEYLPGAVRSFFILNL